MKWIIWINLGKTSYSLGYVSTASTHIIVFFLFFLLIETREHKGQYV